MAIYSVTNIVATDERDFTYQLVNALDSQSPWSLVRTDADFPTTGRDLYVLQNTVHNFYVRISSSYDDIDASGQYFYSPTIMPFLLFDANSAPWPNPATMKVSDSTSYNTVAGKYIFYAFRHDKAPELPIKALLLSNTQTPDFYLFIEMANGMCYVFAYMLFSQRAELTNGASRTHETMAFWQGYVENINTSYAAPVQQLFYPIRIYSDGMFSGFLRQSDAPTLIEEEEMTENGTGFFSPAVVHAQSSDIFPPFVSSAIGPVGCIFFNQESFLPNTNPNSGRQVSDSVCVPDVYWHWQKLRSPYEDIQYGSSIYRHIGNLPGNVPSPYMNSLIYGGGVLVRIG